MDSKNHRIMIIAGEASGDKLGGKLMAALKETSNPITFYGIGGEKMQEQGLTSLFPMQKISLMGFTEILPHIISLKHHIQQTVEYIEEIEPNMVITIDSPGFNYRVIKALKERNHITMPKCVHYVAPTVWAYKPKRAIKTAALFDHLLCILPFEPPYFEKVGLEASFVGHPALDESYRPGAGEQFRKTHDIDRKTPLICMMPGSRRTELKKLLPIFHNVLNQLYIEYPEIRVVIPTIETAYEQLKQATVNWPGKPILVTEETEKKAAMQAANVGLVKSGTITLEAAMAGLPMITTYKVNTASAWLLRRMIQIPYVNLLNILEGKEIIPEYLQENCKTEKLAPALKALLENPEKCDAQKEDYIHALEKMKAPKGKKAANTAAEKILEIIG